MWKLLWQNHTSSTLINAPPPPYSSIWIRNNHLLLCFNPSTHGFHLLRFPLLFIYLFIYFATVRMSYPLHPKRSIPVASQLYVHFFIQTAICVCVLIFYFYFCDVFVIWILFHFFILFFKYSYGVWQLLPHLLLSWMLALSRPSGSVRTCSPPPDYTWSWSEPRTHPHNTTQWESEWVSILSDCHETNQK